VVALLGDAAAYGLVTHTEDAYGSWQLWRNGRFLSRYSIAYGDSYVGYGGTGSVYYYAEIAHNVVLVNGVGFNAHDGEPKGQAQVTRLESKANYSFASMDLTNRYLSGDTWAPEAYQNNAVKTVVRDFIFVRDLETLLIFDRIESDTSGRSKTFLAHCETNFTTSGANTATCTPGGGTQQMVITSLLPASRSYRVVVEGGSKGQYRLEVDTTPGTAQSYMLHVVQAKAVAGSTLTPSVVDNGSTYTVTLDGTHSVVLAKGMTSTGGSITISGSTTSLRSDVQAMSITDSGPYWQESAPVTVGHLTAASTVGHFLPVFSLSSDATQVILKTNVPGATIYWSTAGPPARTVANKYTGPITVSSGATIYTRIWVGSKRYNVTSSTYSVY
jgi:hypothetical protein